VLVVGRHIDVVQAPVDRDALGPRERRGIDDVERAGLAGNADHHATAVLGHRDVVGMIAQRHLLDELAALALEHVERGIGLIAGVDLATVGRKTDPMRPLDPLDDLHDLVGRRIDDVNAVAGAVGHVDANRIGRGRSRAKRNHKE
jgi:hypothetical protein